MLKEKMACSARKLIACWNYAIFSPCPAPSSSLLTSNWWTRSSTEEGAAVPEFDMLSRIQHEIVNRWNRMMSGSHTKLSTILRVNTSNSWTAPSAPRVSQSVTANAITVCAPAPRPASPPRFALVVYEHGHRWSWLARAWACSRERESGVWSRGIWSRGSWLWSRGNWPRDLSSQRWRLWGSRDRRLGAFSFSQPRPRPSPARTGEPRRELSRAALRRTGESRSAPHPTRASSCRGESPSRRVRGVSPARVSYSRRRRRSRFVHSSSSRRRSSSSVRRRS